MKPKKFPLTFTGMVKIPCILLFLFIFTTKPTAQTQEDRVWLIASQLPEFHYGGETSTHESFARYVQDSLQLPASDCRGKVLVSFVVEKDSTISTVEIRQGLDDCPGHEEEVRRLLLSMPSWIPGKTNGETVRVSMRMPIIFESKP